MATSNLYAPQVAILRVRGSEPPGPRWVGTGLKRLVTSVKEQLATDASQGGMFRGLPMTSTHADGDGEDTATAENVEPLNFLEE